MRQVERGNWIDVPAGRVKFAFAQVKRAKEIEKAKHQKPDS